MRTTSLVRAMTLAMALAVPTSAYAAESVADCYERVTRLCADAMEGSNWLERFSIGVICSGMLVGCNTQIIIQK